MKFVLQAEGLVVLLKCNYAIQYIPIGSHVLIPLFWGIELKTAYINSSKKLTAVVCKRLVK